MTHCLLSSPGGGVLPCPSITKSSCSTCKGKHHRSAAASNYDVTHFKVPGPALADHVAISLECLVQKPGQWFHSLGLLKASLLGFLDMQNKKGSMLMWNSYYCEKVLECNKELL